LDIQAAGESDFSILPRAHADASSCHVYLLKSHRRSLRRHAAVRVTVIDPVFFKPYMVLVLENLPATAAHREELAARTSNAGTF